MRIFLMCLSVLLLSSCIGIDVTDFGSYWDKGYLDPALSGKWVMIDPAKPGKIDNSDYSEFVRKNNNTYQVIPSEGRKGSHQEPAGLARTLKVGNYFFLMIPYVEQHGSGLEGAMYRYNIKGGKFLLYPLDHKKFREFLKEKYPEAKNIAVNETPNDAHRKSEIRIRTFDEGTFKILSDIPDTPAFW